MWAKWIETQGAQVAIIINLSEVKEFDLIHVRKSKQNGIKPQAVVKMPTGKKGINAVQVTNPDDAQYMGRYRPSTNKMNHFRWVCRSARGSMVHNIEEEADQEQKNHIETVHINSINFNTIHSIIAANLKTSHKVIITVQYKVDIGSNGNIMSLYINKKLFPRATKEHLAATRNTNIKLKIYKQTIIT